MCAVKSIAKIKKRCCSVNKNLIIKNSVHQLALATMIGFFWWSNAIVVGSSSSDDLFEVPERDVRCKLSPK